MGKIPTLSAPLRNPLPDYAADRHNKAVKERHPLTEMLWRWNLLAFRFSRTNKRPIVSDPRFGPAWIEAGNRLRPLLPLGEPDGLQIDVLNQYITDCIELGGNYVRFDQEQAKL